MFRIYIAWVLGVSLAFSAHAQQITGTVVTSGSNTPIANALVTLHGGSIQVNSASDGSFIMDITGTNLLIVGAAKGHFYQSITLDSPATNVILALDAVPTTDNASYQIQSPDQCGSCHPKQLDDWQNSPMANAGFNTWVNDIYAGNGTAGGMGGFVYTRDSAFAHSNPNSARFSNRKR